MQVLTFRTCIVLLYYTAQCLTETLPADCGYEHRYRTPNRFAIHQVGQEICRYLETSENTCKPNGGLGCRNGFFNSSQLFLAQFL